MASSTAAAEDLRKIKDEFKRFLTVEFPPRPPLLDEVRRIVTNRGERRLIINYNDWLNSNPAMARGYPCSSLLLPQLKFEVNRVGSVGGCTAFSRIRWSTSKPSVRP